MQKNKHSRNQIKMIAIALVCAFSLIILTAYFLSLIIKGDFFSSDKRSSQKSSSGNSISSSNADSLLNNSGSGSTALTHDRTAVDFIDYTVPDLRNELGDVYNSLGYLDGGYTISNSDIFPNFQFVVPTDAKGNILSGNIQAVIVTSGGKILKDISVGMTYKEMKNIINKQIKPMNGETEEQCTMAVIENDSYTVMITFESSGGKSVMALVKPNSQ